MSTREKIQEDVEVAEKENNLNEIVLYNDDVNTFDHVINSLIFACEHTPEQAEQCSIIVHYKGKCTVKNGSFTELKPMCESILSAGITATVL